MGNRKRRLKGNNLPRIVAPVDDQKTRFSFEKLDIDHPEFHSSKCGNDFWQELVQALRESEAIAFDDFVRDNFSESRHRIEFSRTIAPEGFFPGFDSEQLIPFQFSVPLKDKVKGWRVYGYFVNRLFYIVWLDVCHALYNKGEM